MMTPLDRHDEAFSRRIGPNEQLSNPPEIQGRRRYVEVWILIGLTLAAVLIRARYWNLPVRCDEAAMFLQYSSGQEHPIREFLCSYSNPGRHGFHGLAVVLLSKLTGLGFPWVRLPAFVAGVLAIPLTFVALRFWLGLPAAMWAAVLMVCSPWSVAMSVNARGYSMAICFLLAAMGCIGRAVTSRSARFYITAGLALGAAVYTIHTTVYFVVAIAGWFVWKGWAEPVQRRSWIRAAFLTYGSMILTIGLMFFPIIARGNFGNVIGNPIVTPRPVSEIATRLPGYCLQMANMLTDGLNPAAVLGGLMVLGMIVAVVRRHDRALFMAAVLAVIPVILLVQRLLPPLRTMTYLLPFAFGLAGFGTAALLEKMQVVWHTPGRLNVRAVAVVFGVLMSCCLGRSLMTLSDQRGLHPEGDVGVNDAISAVARLTTPDDVIFSQMWINSLIRYQLWEMGQPAPRIYRPRSDIQRAVLFWPSRWAENKEVVDLLASYRRDEILFDDGQTQIIRISRKDESNPTNQARQIAGVPEE